jgi:hypothetical protein
VATVLCLIAGLPGVVDQSNMDAKWINALPATGVALILGITLFTVRRTGLGHRRRWLPLDGARAVIAAALIAISLPVILADVGVYVGDVPIVGQVFMSKELVDNDGRATTGGLVAVHLGHHHGADGLAFAVTALLLTRGLGTLARSRLRIPLSAYIALMFVYGVTNAVQDFWGEQLVKRGTTGWHFPSVTQPTLTPAWGMMLAATVILTTSLLYVNSRVNARMPSSAEHH